MDRFGASHKHMLLASATLAIMASTGTAQAQSDGATSRSGTLLDEIVVTGTKQSRGELLQDVAVTISAFSSKQLDTLKLTDVKNLANAVPNVSFEESGSYKGTANFQIRGLGLNSSIPSSAPTVGTFVNGVYMGTNLGILVDTFDLEGIEVLRGPQGTLFGRNVTGGAVLIQNKRPTQELSFEGRARIETGPEYNVSVAGGAPLNDAIAIRLAAIYRFDKGYFDNKILPDKHYGKTKSYTVRPSIRFEPSDRTDIVIFGEFGKMTGDGPIFHAPDYTGFGTPGGVGSIPPRGFKYKKIYTNFRGVTDLKWKSTSLEINQEVGDNGTITNVAGWRKMRIYTEFDADGSEATVAHSGGFSEQEQFSNELRYNGTFGIATVTVGALYFWQKSSDYIARINLDAAQGGYFSEDVFGLFGNLDLQVTDNLTLQFGGRYTYEKKKASISALASQTPGVVLDGNFGIPGNCTFNYDAHRADCSSYQYHLKDSWKNFSPKFGIKYQPTSNVLLYATAQKSFRSGGMNIRYNSALPAIPYNEENQKAAEIGFKTDLFDKKTRLNGAAFYTKIKGLQRDVTEFDPVNFASYQRTLNTADATIKGFELEYIQEIVPQVIFNANVGYVHARYDSMRFDITQDGVVDDFDLRQRLPRVSPWTFGAGLHATQDVGRGTLTLNLSYSHRDASYFTDYNYLRADGASAKLLALDIFDASISYSPNKQLTFTIYGKNLGNDFNISSRTPIAYPVVNGCSCVINKGRVIGAEVSYTM